MIVMALMASGIHGQYYKGGYIRQSFYETGQVDHQTMLANTDLMLMGFSPYADGTLWFELPHNEAHFSTGAGYSATLGNRTGVASFSGAAGAVMNGGQHLLIGAASGAKQFTFATWMYVNKQESFVPGKFIFKKAEGNSEISFRVGGNYGMLIFRVVENGTTYAASADAAATGITANGWYHVSITFNGSLAAGNQLKLYVNGTAKNIPMSIGTAFPNTLPAIRSDFILGANFEGSLDETLVNTLPLSAGEVNSLYQGAYNFSNWNLTKTAAFWNYDDATNPGKDLRSYKNLLADIKNKIAGKAIKLTACVHGGAWQSAVSTETSRLKLAGQISELINANNLDGVDIDMEWPANTTAGFANYNAEMLAIRNAIGNQKLLTLSLHPVSYKVSAEVIAAADYIAMQMYGPQTTFWDFETFKTWSNNFLAYGFPKEKLVMGLPFFGTTGSAQTAYRNIVNANPGLSFDADNAVVNGSNFSFNGVSTIARKAEFVRDQNLAGIMSWDLATDMPYISEYSLMKAVVAGLTKYPDVTFGAITATFNQGIITVKFSTLVEHNPQKFIIEASRDTASYFVPIDSLPSLAQTNLSTATLDYTLSKSAQDVTRLLGLHVIMVSLIVAVFGAFLFRHNTRKRIAGFITALLATSIFTLFSCHKNAGMIETGAGGKKEIYIRVAYVNTNGEKTHSPAVKLRKQLRV